MYFKIKSCTCKQLPSPKVGPSCSNFNEDNVKCDQELLSRATVIKLSIEMTFLKFRHRDGNSNSISAFNKRSRPPRKKTHYQRHQSLQCNTQTPYITEFKKPHKLVFLLFQFKRI